MKKSERLDLIKKMVLSHEIETQHELLKLLADYGLELTQATISRDMNEIGIVKIPSGTGRYVYGLSQDSGKRVVQRPASIKKRFWKCLKKQRAWSSIFTSTLFQAIAS